MANPHRVMQGVDVAHPVIYLWTHPRSVSSALERVMLERGDLYTFHEPFIYLYYLGDARKSLAYFDPDPSHPIDYAGIKSMILERARETPVFVKDMCYYVSPYITQDAALLDDAIHTYLIRDPARSIPSYYKLDPGVTSEEIGLETLYQHFEHVKAASGKTPVVVDAADLVSDPEGTVRAYCDAVGLPFIESSLTWDHDALPDAWAHVAGWHTDLAGSAGMGQVKPAKTSLDDAPHLRELYAHHLPFYNALRQHALSPSSG